MESMISILTDRQMDRDRQKNRQRDRRSLRLHTSQHTSHLLVTMYSKTCVNGHSKIDRIKILMTNGSLMKVKSIAECPLEFDLH